VQQEIVAEVEGYQKEIERLKAAIAGEEAKIQSVLSRAWGENGPTPAEG
jgi:hypothetical protein